MVEQFDVVGDVHGMRATLEAALAALGYGDGPRGWSHADDRRLVFVGDLIDKGPDPLGCLELVEDLVEAGRALLVLGNHEINAAHYMMGLREHSADNAKQFAETRSQVQSRPERWDRALAFIERTPTRLELDGGKLRVVHACWNDAELARLPVRIDTPELWRRTAKGGDLNEAVEVCLKGPERDVAPFVDKYGKRRTRERVDWWDEYPQGAPLVAFGHYWFSSSKGQRPELLGPGRNAACVDFSVGNHETLVALRYPERCFESVPCVDP